MTSLALLIPMAAAVHGMGTPVTSGRPREDDPTPWRRMTGRRAQEEATRWVAEDIGALRVPDHATLEEGTGVDLPDEANSTFADRVRAKVRIGTRNRWSARFPGAGVDRHLTLVEDTGLVNCKALPAETPATDDGSTEPPVGPATSTAPIEPEPAPATPITQGASIPVVSIPGPTAGTASTSAWWSSSASPRSA